MHFGRVGTELEEVRDLVLFAGFFLSWTLVLAVGMRAFSLLVCGDCWSSVEPNAGSSVLEGIRTWKLELLKCERKREMQMAGKRCVF